MKKVVYHFDNVPLLCFCRVAESEVCHQEYAKHYRYMEMDVKVYLGRMACFSGACEQMC